MPNIETDDGRLYAIRDNCLGWRAGCTSDGRQVLLLQRSDRSLTAILFEMTGNLLAGMELIDVHLSDWERATGFLPGTIWIHRFAYEDVLIRDLPDLYIRFEAGDLDVNKVPSQEDRLKKAVEEWRANARFVFVWGQENWMNSDGSVYAT